jgi:uncharacterized membrane protein
VYVGLKLLHVILAIVAVGFNLSYGILLARAGREPEHLGHVLRTVQFLDSRFANPAYGLLLVTGVGMTFAGGIPLTTFWIMGALTLFVVLLLMGIFLYSPALRNQIAALDRYGVDSAEYRRAASRQTIVGAAFAVPLLLILYLMVFKPAP